MNHGGHSIILRGLYALQLQPWLESFPNEMKILSISDIKGSKAQIQHTLNEVFEFISLPPSDIEDVQAKNSRNYSEMSSEVTPSSVFLSPSLSVSFSVSLDGL
jgi:RecA-family ATPase